MKKFFFVFLSFIFVSTYAFAQYSPTSPVSAWSVKSWSTASIYGSDSDNISSADIFDQTKSFFSLQYSPIDTSDAILGNAQTRAIQGYFGVAIGKEMYFALAAAYDANLSRVRNKTLDERSVYGESLVVVRPVLRINKIVSLEYMYSKNGIVNVINNAGTKTYDNNDIQNHRLAVSIWCGSAGRLTIPVTVSLKDLNDTLGGLKEERITLDISPDFYIPLQAGPLENIDITADFGMDLRNKADGLNGKDPSNIYGQINVSPFVNWQVAEGRAQFGIQPVVGIIFENRESGYALGAAGGTTTFKVTPYLSMPFGTVIKVGEYVELRGGFEYNLNYEISFTEDKTTSVTTKEKEQRLISQMAAMTGLGVNVGENVSIDFMLRLLMLGTKTDRNLFSLDSVGMQATYRF